MIGEVTANLSVRMPTLYRARMALAILLVGWAAGLMLSVFRGIRVDVE